MKSLCKYGIDMTAGVEAYILCSAVNVPYCFQRYCSIKGRVVHTDGAENCKIKQEMNDEEEKVEFVEPDYAPIEEIAAEVIETPEVKSPKKTNGKKRIHKGKVILVTNNRIIYEYRGEVCHKIGHFDVKVGDEIEI